MRCLPPLLSVLALCSTLLFAGHAHAEGTHFMLEFSGGANALRGDGSGESSHFMPAYGVALGLGGKMRNDPTRLYFVLRYDRSHLLSSDRLRTDFDQIDLSLRMLWPMFKIGSGSLRFYIEGGVGPTIISTRITGPNGKGVEGHRVRLGGHASTGLQYRITRGFSLGLRGDLSIAHEGGLSLEQQVGGVDLGLRPGLAFTTAWHF